MTMTMTALTTEPHTTVTARSLRSERLEQLRRVVDAAPDDQFEMELWSKESDCGTTRCAASWACVDPWFRKHTNIDKLFYIGSQGEITPRADAETIFVRLARLFGLLKRDAEALFGANPGYALLEDAVSKADVLANIDRLIYGEPAEVYEAYDRSREAHR